MYKIHKVLLMSLISLASGCSVMSQSTVIPEGGPVLSDVYYKKLEDSGQSGLDAARNLLANSKQPTSLDGYTRDAKVELDSQFKRLPNPDLVMFVFPHLAGKEQTPVPGYSTTFPLYEKHHYALPGEF